MHPQATLTFSVACRKCWYGNVTQECRSDQVYVARCSGADLTPQQQAFRFVPISGSMVDTEVLIQVANINDQRCFERLKRQIYLTPCNASNPLQRWFASNGTSFFSSDNKFEISQLGFTRQCMSSDHHPKPGEISLPRAPLEECFCFIWLLAN
jgi:hypothetical protein